MAVPDQQALSPGTALLASQVAELQQQIVRLQQQLNSSRVQAGAAPQP